MILINYVLVVVIFCARYQLSYGENLICVFADTSYHNWGSIYSCNVNSLENGNNDKVIIGYKGAHVGSKKDKDVKMVHISETKAQYIPADIGKLFSLTAFYFGSSELLAIKSSDFDDMPDLKYLELGWNKLTIVPTCAFSKLTKLVYLSVHKNPVTKLPIGALSSNVDLKEMWIIDSKINIDDKALQLRKDGLCKPSENLEVINYGEYLVCAFGDKSYHNWGPIYSCNVNSLYNGNNNKIITGYTGVHVGSKKDKDVKMVHISETKAQYIPANIGKLFSLTAFYFGSSELLAIKSSDFDDMPDLKYLELGWNKLTIVPTCAFSKLTKLVYLSVHKNPVTKLPIGALSSNVDLKEMWIIDSKINIDDKALQLRKDGLCKPSENLEVINYGEYLVCAFEDKTYYNWGPIYSCNVNSLYNGNNNKIITGYTGAHVGSKKDKDVKMIHVSETKAQYIPANIGKLFSLTSFYFGSSELIAIKSKDFEDMQDLERLELGWNKITKIPADAFSTLTKLKYLSLYINQVEELPIDVFSNNVVLKEIWFSQNQIKFIGTGIFDELSQLRKLELIQNPCVSKIYTGLVQLQKDMETMCKNPKEFSQMKAKLMDCEKNQHKLIKTNEKFNELNSFNINCNFNEMSKIYSCVTQDLYIIHKDLELNRVIGKHLIPKSNEDVTELIVENTSMFFLSNNIFKTFPALETIKIFNSKLRQLSEGDFNSATNLESFIAHGNEIKSLGEKIFDGAQEQLKNIELESNQIKQISIETFNGLKQLKMLSLKDNLISELHLGTFKDVVMLETLILTSNQIKFIDGKLLQFNTNLKKLAIDQNKLREIGEDILDYAVNLTYVNLNKNTCIDESLDEMQVNDLKYVIQHCCKHPLKALKIYNCGLEGWDNENKLF